MEEFLIKAGVYGKIMNLMIMISTQMGQIPTGLTMEAKIMVILIILVLSFWMITLMVKDYHHDLYMNLVEQPQ